MKAKKYATLIMVFAISASLVACKKDKTNLEEIETTFELSESQAVTDNVTQDANDVIEETAARYGLLGGGVCNVPQTMNWTGACATVTVTGNFPAKNIKIDFGTGCTNANGVVRKGVVNIVLTDSLLKTGSIATINFDNYYVNNFKKEGTITRTNTTTAGSTNRSVNRKVVNGKITSPSGKVWMHESNIDIVQTAGNATPCDLRDDVFSITGTRTVTNAQDKTRTSTTQTPLQKKMNCSNIDQGLLKVQGPNHYALIDFGNGTCDNEATISIDGRPARTIRLR
jgi:hypothetical protein